MNERRDGFTLPELLLVMALLALIAGTATWSLAGTVERQAHRAAITRLIDADHQARQLARATGREVGLLIDLEGQRVSVMSGHETPMVVTWPRTLWLARVKAQRVEHRAGEYLQRYGATGQCATYAIELRGSRSTQWIVVSGITGSAEMLSGETEVEAYFELLSR